MLLLGVLLVIGVVLAQDPGTIVAVTIGVVSLGAGYYLNQPSLIEKARIWNSADLRCLYLPGSQNYDGGLPELRTCGQEAEYSWAFYSTDDANSVTIRPSSYSGKCLSLGSGQTNGSKVSIWTCTAGKKEQYWQKAPIAGTRYLLFRNTLNPSKCLNVQSVDNYDGGPLTILDCDASVLTQQWEILRSYWGSFSEVTQLDAFGSHLVCSSEEYGAGMYEARIMDAGSDWNYACKATPTQYNGRYIDGSRDCYNATLGMYGRFPIQDVRCRPKYTSGQRGNCISTRKRKYTYYLDGIPTNFNREKAAMSTPVVINGKLILRADGVEYGFLGIGTYGVFYVDDPTCGFVPQWTQIAAACVDSGGFKRYTYKLANYNFGNWANDCSSFSLVIDGYQRSWPTECGSDVGVAYFNVPAISSCSSSRICPASAFPVADACCVDSDGPELFPRAGRIPVYARAPGIQLFGVGFYFVIQWGADLVVDRVHYFIGVEDLRTGSGTNPDVRRYVHSFGLITDQAGHIVACVFGGSGIDYLNMFPINPQTNRAMGAFERSSAQRLERLEAQAPGVVMHGVVLLYRAPGNLRPYRIECRVAYYRNGVLVDVDAAAFDNPP